MNTHVTQIQTPEHLNAQMRSAPDISEQNLAANVSAGGQDFLSSNRKPGEFEQALRHSGRVRRLKFILPAIAAIVVVGFIGAIAVRNINIPGFSMGSLDLSDGKLVMEHPQLSGIDGDQRPFNLVAEKAIQDLSKPSELELEAVNARLPMDSGDFADVTAEHGIYDSAKKTLQLTGEVTVKTDSGMAGWLSDVDVDMASGTLTTSKPVTLKSETADIFADSMLIENHGDHIIFEKRVRLTLYPAETNKSAGTNSNGG